MSQRLISYNTLTQFISSFVLTRVIDHLSKQRTFPSIEIPTFVFVCPPNRNCPSTSHEREKQFSSLITLITLTILLTTLHIPGPRVFVYMFLSSLNLVFFLTLWVVSSYPHLAIVIIIISGVSWNDPRKERPTYTGAFSFQCRHNEMPYQLFAWAVMLDSVPLFKFFMLLGEKLSSPLSFFSLNFMAISKPIFMSTRIFIFEFPSTPLTASVDSSVPQKQKQMCIDNLSIIINFYEEDGSEEIDILYGQPHQPNETSRLM